MLIVADENIPFVHEAFGTLGAVRLYAGREIDPSHVRDADVLLVRSVTRVDAGLLEGSRVRFVGSATIGTDHVDDAYLAERGIAFAHAPGSNAESVVEYVAAALLTLAVRRGERLRGRTVGIVGCGSIGSRLARRLPELGLRVLKNDPPRAEAAERAGTPHDFLPLDAVLAEADVVTIHVPLVRRGPHATTHLFDADRLARLKPGAWLLNTARGAAVDGRALGAALEAGRLESAVLDVWENEPTPDPELLRRVDLATPHIAGYSYDGKVQGTVMLYDAVTTHFGAPKAWDAETVLAPAPEDRLLPSPPDPALPETDWLHHLVRSMYDIAADDHALRAIVDQPAESHAAFFSGLRRAYPRRRTFARHRLPARWVPDALRTAVADGLGIVLDDRPGDETGA